LTSVFAPKTEIPGRLHFGLSLLAGACVIGLWCFLTYGGHVRPDFLAPPHQVVLAGWKGLIRGSLLGHIWSSVAVIFSGFLLASVFAVPIGILMGSFKVVEALIEPIRSSWRSRHPAGPSNSGTGSPVCPCDFASPAAGSSPISRLPWPTSPTARPGTPTI
jgi:hypothetical protein